MKSDYPIPKGTTLRFISEVSIDPFLRKQIQEVYLRYDCLKAYCILSVKRGIFFPKKILTLCVVYDDAEAYKEADLEISKRINAYISRKSGLIDYMIFDWNKPEEKSFVEVLMSKFPFTKKD